MANSQPFYPDDPILVTPTEYDSEPDATAGAERDPNERTQQALQQAVDSHSHGPHPSSHQTFVDHHIHELEGDTVFPNAATAPPHAPDAGVEQDQAAVESIVGSEASHSGLSRITTTTTASGVPVDRDPEVESVTEDTKRMTLDSPTSGTDSTDAFSRATTAVDNAHTAVDAATSALKHATVVVSQTLDLATERPVDTQLANKIMSLADAMDDLTVAMSPVHKLRREMMARNGQERGDNEDGGDRIGGENGSERDALTHSDEEPGGVDV